MKKLLITLISLVLMACIAFGVYMAFLYQPPQTYPDPTVAITLSDGSVLNAVLYPDIAPNTVANFISLAKSGFYNGLEIFRVVPGVFIQTGDPYGNGTGGAGYCIKGEFAENGFTNNLSHTRGTLSMSRQPSGYDTASSQFFIMQGSYPEYDGKYAAFGKLTDSDSLHVLDQLVAQPVDGSYMPLNRIYITSIVVETYGAEYPLTKIEQEEKR